MSYLRAAKPFGKAEGAPSVQVLRPVRQPGIREVRLADYQSTDRLGDPILQASCTSGSCAGL